MYKPLPFDLPCFALISVVDKVRKFALHQNLRLILVRRYQTILAIMCPECGRALANPLLQCRGARCPFCGYKPGDHDRVARARTPKEPPDVSRESHFPHYDYTTHRPKRKAKARKPAHARPQDDGLDLFKILGGLAGLALLWFTKERPKKRR